MTLRSISQSRMLIAFIAIWFSQGHASAKDPQLVAGRCEASSHTAEGPIGSDLTKRQSRFYCDTAVIIFLDDRPGHVLIQFVEKKSHSSSPLGFGGKIDGDGQIIQVEHAYLQPGKPIAVSEGYCKFFFQNQKMNGIACGMKLDEAGRRTTAIVGFTASPGQ